MVITVSNDNGLYIVKIPIPSAIAPLTISMETDDENAFLAYIHKELGKRYIIRTYYYQWKKFPFEGKEDAKEKDDSFRGKQVNRPL